MNNILNFSTFEHHLINDNTPSIYFRKISNLLNEEYPYNILGKLITTKQNPKYHPEGNVWEHTMQVVDNAANFSFLSSNKRIFMWSSLLHDIGKGTTTKVRKGKITAYNHDIEGAKLTKAFLTVFTNDKSFIDGVCKLVEWHMQPLFINKDLPFSKIKDMIIETSVSEIGLLSLCDRLGRNNLSKENKEKEIEFIIQFLKKCYSKIIDPIEKDKINYLISHLFSQL